MGDGKWAICKHCGTKWGAKGPPPGGAAGDGARGQGGGGRDGDGGIINKTIDDKFFTLNSNKEVRRKQKEEGWQELRKLAMEKGDQGKDDEAADIFKRIKHEKIDFEDEADDIDDPVPLSPHDTKQLSGEINRVYNLVGTYMDKCIKLEKELKEAQGKFQHAVAAEMRMEKRLRDDFELKKRIETQADEMEEEFADEDLPEELLQEKAALLEAEKEARKTLKAHKAKLASIAARAMEAKEAKKAAHQDQGPGKKHQNADEEEQKDDAAMEEPTQSPQEGAAACSGKHEIHIEKVYVSNSNCEKEKHEQEEKARRDELAREARLIGEKLIAEREAASNVAKTKKASGKAKAATCEKKQEAHRSRG
jgi:hypothetical protein